MPCLFLRGRAPRLATRTRWGFRIDYRIQGADKWTFAGFSCTNSFDVTCRLSGCTTYEFRVRALNCYGSGAWSDSATSWIGGQPAASVPGPVTGLTLTPGDHTITANWTAVAGAESYTVAFRAAGTDAWTEAGIATDTTFEITCDFAACTLYEVRVQATNCKGDGEWSAPVTGWIGSTQPPAAAPGLVTGLTLTPGDTSITASWDALDGAESYSVQYRAVGATDWTDAGLSTTTSLEITGELAPCTNYEVRVSASNCKGDGDYSAPVTGYIGGAPPTAAPDKVALTSVGTGDADTISVAWTALDDADSYEVSYRAQGDDQWTVAGISTTTSFDLTENLVECTFYEVRVRASNCKGDGDYSDSGVGYIGGNPDDCGGETCAECSGGVKQLTIGYTGKKAADVVVTDAQGNQLFSGNLNQGDQFTINGSNADGTLGSKITLTTDKKSVTIKTNCKQAVGPGFEVGKFAVLEGTSAGGDLCPVTACPVCHKTKCKYHCKACKCKAKGDKQGCDAAYQQCAAHNGGHYDGNGGA